MADYPDTIYTPRVVANAPLVVFDASKTTIGYAEDVNLSNDEIVAIQETLGLNPEGSYADVVTRLNQYTAYDQGLNTTDEVSFENIIISRADAGTNTPGRLTNWIRQSTGTVADGFGADMQVYLENEAGTLTQAGFFGISWTDVTDRTAQWFLKVIGGGAMGTIASFSSDLIQFFSTVRTNKLEVRVDSAYVSYTGSEIALTDAVNGTKKLSELYGFLSQATADTLYPAINNPFITIGNPSNLSNERALTAGANVTLTDGGAGSTATLKSRSLITVGNGFQSTSYIVATTGVELYGFMYPGSNLVAGTLTHTCKVSVVAIVGNGTWTIDLLDKTNTTTVATISSINTTGIKTLTVTDGNVPTGSSLFDVKVTVVGGSGTRTIVLGAVEFETQGY